MMPATAGARVPTRGLSSPLASGFLLHRGGLPAAAAAAPCVHNLPRSWERDATYTAELARGRITPGRAFARELAVTSPETAEPARRDATRAGAH